MIKKTKSGYVMDSVWREAVTKYSLTEEDQLEVNISFFRANMEVCGNCSSYGRHGYISLRAGSPGDEGFWICDECAEKFAPELFKIMIKERS